MRKSLFVFFIPLLSLSPLRAQDTLRKIRQKEVVVEATRLPVTEKQIPYVVSVVDRPHKSEGLSLSEALRGVPGAQIDNRFNFAVGDRIILRGFGARTQFGVRGVHVLSDDIPLTFADGQSAIESFDPALLGRAEVLRGPASTLFGNATGGVLLFHSQSVSSEPFTFVADNTTGSFGLQRNALALSGHTESLTAEASLSQLTYRGYRAHSDAKVDRGRARFDLNTSERSNLYVTLAAYKLAAKNPGALNATQIATDPTITDKSNLTYQTGKIVNQQEASARWRYLTDSGYVQATLFGIKRKVDNPLVRRIVALDRDAGGLRVDWSGRSHYLGLPQSFTIGADLDLQSDDRQNYLNSGGARDTLTLNQKENVTSVGVFYQTLIELSSSLNFMLGARFDRVHFGVKDHLNDSIDDSGDRTMQAASPAVGLSYIVDRSFSLYTNLTTSFETPTTTEFANRPNEAGGFNPDLSPQTALSVEAGATGSSDLFSYQLSAFTTTIEDELIGYEVSTFPGRSFFRNAGKAVHRGFEVAVDANVFERIDLRATATVLDAHYTDYNVGAKNFANNHVPGIAGSQFVLSAVIELPFEISLQPELQYTGRTWTDDANTANVSPYALTNLRAECRGIKFTSDNWQSRLVIAAGATNIFNRRYISAVSINAVGGRYFEPGSGRAFYISARLGLSKE